MKILYFNAIFINKSNGSLINKDVKHATTLGYKSTKWWQMFKVSSILFNTT